MIIDGLRQISELRRNQPLALQVNKILSDLGFKKILLKTKFDRDRDYFDDLTLSTAPTIERSSNRYNFLEHRLKNKKGYDFSDYVRFFPLDSKEDVIIDLERVGRYYPERNLLIFYHPLFSHLDIGTDCLFALLDVIKEIVEKYKIAKQEIKNKVLESLVSRFSDDLKSEITQLESNIDSRANSIKSYESSIITEMRTRSLELRKLEAIKGFDKNGKDKILSEIEAIKTLPFVKSVEIDADAIKINVGKIFINYQGKEVYIGDFFFKINPTQINVDCYDRRNNDNGEFIHPHISGTDTAHICFGDRSAKVKEYLADFDLKRLVYFIFLWAKSYNPDSPYSHIDEWIEGDNNTDDGGDEDDD